MPPRRTPPAGRSRAALGKPGEPVSAREQTVSARERTVSARERTVSARERTVSARERTSPIVDGASGSGRANGGRTDAAQRRRLRPFDLRSRASIPLRTPDGRARRRRRPPWHDTTTRPGAVSRSLRRREPRCARCAGCAVAVETARSREDIAREPGERPEARSSRGGPATRGALSRRALRRPPCRGGRSIDHTWCQPATSAQ